MNRNPIIIGKAIDFMGEEYDVEDLPDAATCDEGDTCTVCHPGNSGWYQTQYKVINGEWIVEWTTAPWQMFV